MSLNGHERLRERFLDFLSFFLSVFFFFVLWWTVIIKGSIYNHSSEFNLFDFCSAQKVTVTSNLQSLNKISYFIYGIKETLYTALAKKANWNRYIHLWASKPLTHVNSWGIESEHSNLVTIFLCLLETSIRTCCRKWTSGATRKASNLVRNLARVSGDNASHSTYWTECQVQSQSQVFNLLYSPKKRFG